MKLKSGVYLYQDMRCEGTHDALGRLTDIIVLIDIYDDQAIVEGAVSFEEDSTINIKITSGSVAALIDAFRDCIGITKITYLGKL